MAKRRYFKELKMSQLRAMTALADGRGFAGAAALLDVATPSVWQQIRGLEDEFKVSLVEVDGQKVRLGSFSRFRANTEPRSSVPINYRCATTDL
jgi:hypothetical protein